MGNTCVGPNLGNKGFLNSVTNAVWKNRQQDSLPAPNQDQESNSGKDKKDGSTKDDTSGNSEGKGSDSTPAAVQSTAPPEVKIAGNEAKAVEKPGQPEVKAGSQPDNNNKKPAEEAKPNKPSHMKRVSSAGLQVESVLQRKTGNLKEIYTLGKKLGQGQFGTTFLCVRRQLTKSLLAKQLLRGS
ncbi:Calcium-dependent protein kinase [Sesamum angolense]|uniref:Calcium-dependent protein kinase n=1 Tax=Sesamum angolense TaxID=2727404 RepID=A0AAE1W0B6_9LAMI|nr:Calcium-dependent protein kinase [Sesamum angolense]